MSFRYWYKDPDGEVTEIVDMVDVYGGAELVTNAEEGSVGTGRVVLLDPRGEFMIRGHRLFVVTETEAAGDDFGGVVWVGYTFGRKVARYSNPTVQDGRDINVTLVDLNTLLTDRIQHGPDVDREAEQEIDRVRWLMSTAEMGPVLDDDTFVASVDGVDMDAVDYTGVNPQQILDDCAQQSGRNYFLLWQDSGSTVPDFYLWYRHGTGSFWPASIAISNFPDEWDNAGIFVPSRDAELDRDPSRVYSNIREVYDGGAVLEARENTAMRFRRRWTTGQAELVKTATKARRRAQRTLQDIDTESDEITVAIEVPRSLVNSAMAGQKIPVHFQHLPGYGGDDFIDMRIKARTVREVNPFLVELALVLTGESPGEGDTTESSGNAYAVLDYAHNFQYGVFDIRFEASGDAPPSGWGIQPTVGLLTPLSDAEPRPFYGIQVDGTGTVDVRFTASAAGVSDGGQVFTVSWQILLNGVVVATESKTTPLVTAYWTDGNSVFATALAVAPGDIITARVVCGPNIMAFFTIPAGTSNGSEQLEVSNGDLS